MAPRSRKRPKIFDDRTTIYMVKSNKSVKIRPNYSRSGFNWVGVGAAVGLKQNDTQQALLQHLRTRADEPQTKPDFQSCQEEDDTPVGFSGSTRITYKERKEKEFERWRIVQESMMDAAIEISAMKADQQCVHCDLNAKLRCNDCGSDQFFCYECATQVHMQRNRLHFIEEWKDGCFIPFNGFTPVFHTATMKVHDTNCITSVRSVTVLNPNGIQRLCQICFCSCLNDGETLVRYGLWPASPVLPKVAFSLQLMELLEALFLECKVSISSFINALKEKVSPLLPHMVNFASSLSSESFAEYRYFRHRIRYSRKVCPDRKDSTSCLACPSVEGSLFQSFDACFGLHRRKTRGMLDLPSRHGSLVIENQNVIDKFIEEYPKTYRTKNGREHDCNDFTAGSLGPLDVITGKGKDKLFDEKAIFGSVCKHETPSRFVNLKCGERLGYSVYLIQNILDTIDTEKINVNISYDIACKLSSHLKNLGRQDLLEKITLILPSFHAYAHSAPCQVKFAQQYIEGSGKPDGEQCERLWSYLRGFCAMTKEMTRANRHDALTDAILYYGRKSERKLSTLIVRRIVKASNATEAASHELEKLLEQINKASSRNYGYVDIEMWMTEIKESLAKNTKTLVLDDPNSWRCDYIRCLVQQICLSKKILQNENVNELDELPQLRQLRSVEKHLSAIEKKKKIEERWSIKRNALRDMVTQAMSERRTELIAQLRTLAFERWFLLTLKRKYCKGQKVAKSLSRSINAKVKLIKNAVSVFNEELQVVEVQAKVSIPKIEFQEALCLQSNLYSIDDEQFSNTIPIEVKRKAIDIYYTWKRNEEEVNHCKSEMLNILHNVKIEIKKVQDALQMISPITLLDKGAHAMLRKELRELFHYAAVCLKDFEDAGLLNSADEQYSDLKYIDIQDELSDQFEYRTSDEEDDMTEDEEPNYDENISENTYNDTDYF